MTHLSPLVAPISPLHRSLAPNHSLHCSHLLAPCRFLFDIVANKRNSIDVDKFDYLQRDAMCAGVKTSCDFGRIIACSQVGPLAAGARACENDAMYHTHVPYTCLAQALAGTIGCTRL
jgi:HD superfamily phosphohydrolase